MSPRPYFQHSIDQLRVLFGTNQGNLSGLKKLQQELRHRSTQKSRSLALEVDACLVELNGGRRPKAPKKQPKPPKRETLAQVAQGDLFGTDADDEPSSEQGADDREGPASSTDEAPEEEPEAARPPKKDMPPNDRRRPSKFVRMAHPGIGGRPSKYAPPLSRDLALELPADASNAHRFSVTLDALVTEMKARDIGSKRILLEDGVATDLGTEDFGYVFDFLQEVEIFEDAQVQVILGSRHCSGSVVSILPGKIILALDANLGPRIRSCILKVDSTALLVALKERLEEVEQKTITLNTALADAAVSGADPGGNSQASASRDLGEELDPKQDAAVRSALDHAVSYIWGPPGTGKTHTLATLLGALFADGKRVLVCSNTNQAVNQLLVKLCDHLGTDHPALIEGRVLRQGRVKAEQLSPYAEYLILDKIIERRSHDLHERRAVLQGRIQDLEASLAGIDGVLRLFDEYDLATKRTAQLDAVVTQRQQLHERAQAELDGAIQQQTKAESALATWKAASRLRRALMSGEARLNKHILVATQRVAGIAEKTRDALTAAERAEQEAAEHRARMSALEEELAPHDRAQLVTQQTALQEERRPLREELAGIQEQLADMERSLLANARVIGTTVTRAYLSSRDLGAFDAVVVDEASMILLPALYFVCGLARESVTVSGDFNQLPPIVQSNQQSVFDVIGHDVFWTAGVTRACRRGVATSRVVMLDIQRRMVQPVCDLIIEAMQYKGLQTHACTKTRHHTPAPPPPFDGPLTVIDSSRIWPFESRNAFGSRFNLMHALVVRNLCWHLHQKGFIVDDTRLGICTPYAAQAKLMGDILKDEHLDDRVRASTVHSYQGAERRMMVLDIPESIGSGFGLGRFIQADGLDDDGAKLLNVAVSRTQDHLVILANLTYLDPKLPSLAKLRYYIHESQRRGVVIDAEDVLALRPIMDDLGRYGEGAKIEWDVDQAGQFRQDGFDQVFRLDIQRAKRSVAIFSGFITEERAAKYGDLFRKKIADGVAIRCVTRPPQFNGSMDHDRTKAALDALEAIGVVVDTRKVIHQKVAVVDDEIVWVGSLNPLSHTANTDEIMIRSVSRHFALGLAPMLAISTAARAEGVSPWVAKENPACESCSGRMYYAKGPHGPYFRCEECGKYQSLFRGRGVRRRTK